MTLRDKFACFFIIITVFVMSTCEAQEFICSDNFKSKIAKDIVVVEFWANWNSANQFNELTNLKECQVYRLDIGACMDVQSKYKVTAVPTVIVFDNGIAKEVFKANVMFHLDVDKKTIQNSVDTLLLNKFN